MNIKNSILLRARIAFLVVALFAIAIAYKIIDLQVVEGEKWNTLADQIGLQYRKVKATRGNIFSDNGSLLATSVPYYKVALDPSRVNNERYQKEIDSLCFELSNFYNDVSAQEYKRKITNARVSGRKYLIVNRQQINYQDKKTMSSWPIFKYGRMGGGVIFEKVERRFLPFSYLANRTVGYVNENLEGAGLEYSYNEQLAGSDGEALFRKMAGGNWKPVYDGSDVRPVEGLDLETTIDVNLQDVAEAALLQALTDHEADYGTVVVMEVKTGAIKAISNLSKTKSGKYAELYNYAVGRHGLREPGSTFKLATMMALLEEVQINLDDSIDTGNGKYKIYDNTVRDHEEDGYGTITIREAFEKSSNVAMAKLAEKHFGTKPQKFYDYLNDLWLTRPLGFQMIGEGAPNVKKPEDWSGITLPWMAYGYGLELTPLHTLALFNAVANDGKLIKPIIVKSIQKTGSVSKSFSSEVLIDKICSEKTLQQIRLLLEGVVERGTANNIRNDHYRIAGKTGTAQLLKNGRHSKNYMTSFAGYFPADDPLYSAIVVIENPKGFRQYGSNVAAPVFKDIADKIYATNIRMHEPIASDYRREIGVYPVIRAGNHQDLKMLCNELGVSNHSEGIEEWVRATRSTNSVRWVPAKLQEKLVPDVSGMTLRDALYLLENRGLKVRVEGQGRVKRQSIFPGKKINKGTQIKLELG